MGPCEKALPQIRFEIYFSGWVSLQVYLVETDKVHRTRPFHFLLECIGEQYPIENSPLQTLAIAREFITKDSIGTDKLFDV